MNPNNIRVDRNCVAVEPFEKTSIKVRRESGVAIAEQQLALTRTRVVFGTANGLFRPGYHVYVSGDQCKQAWAKDVYELDGVEFVLMPIDVVRLVDVGEHE